MKSVTRLESARQRDNIFVVFIELAALCGFAIAMPVLEVFGKSPEVFTEARASSTDLWWFAILVALLPPSLLCTIELIVGFIAGKRIAQIVHLMLVACLGGLVTVRALRLGTHLEGLPLLATSILVGGLLATGYARFSAVRQWLRFGSFAPILFASVFLFSSPAHSLVQGAGKVASTAVAVAETPKKRPPIVLLVLDELPVRSLLDAGGGIDAERFPGFGALAENSTWFRNATSVAGHTVHAVPAVFTGQYATAKELHATAKDHPDNIFRLLGNAYRFNVSELTTQLCAVPRCDFKNPENKPTKALVQQPPKDVVRTARKESSPSPIATLLQRARDEYATMVALHDNEAVPEVEHEELAVAPATTSTTPKPVDEGSITHTTVDRTAEQVATVQPTRFSDWLENIDGDTGHPAFNVLHLTLPHNPFYIDSTGTPYQVPTDNRHVLGFYMGKWREDPGAAISAQQRHLLQVRYVDTLITAMRKRLEEQGLWDEAVIIVTADHGSGFDPGGSFRQIDEQSQVSVVGVPLFVRGPGFESGVIDDRPVQTVDVAPTIASVAGIKSPWHIDGIALTELGDKVRTKYIAEATDVFNYRVKTIDVSRHLEQLMARLPSANSDGGGDLAIMKTGPSGELIGRKIDELEFAERADVGSVDIDFPADRNFSQSDTGFVSALVLGTLSNGGANQTVVVVADGRVGATALTFYDGAGREARFVALIPPVWMRGDNHEVSFYLLTENDELAPLD